MKRKIHTTIATLLAAFCIVGAVAPTASAARVVPQAGLAEVLSDPGLTATERKKKPGESNKAWYCRLLKVSRDFNLWLSLEALNAGDKDKSDEHFTIAVEREQEARDFGCSWAKARVIVPEPGFGPIVDPDVQQAPEPETGVGPNDPTVVPVVLDVR